MSNARAFWYKGNRITPASSIVTDSIVRKLLETTPAGTPTRSAIGFQKDFQLELRRCGKFVYAWDRDLDSGRRFWEPSGGAVLSARVPAPSYQGTYCALETYQTSLRPGWREGDLYRAVCRANGWCRVMVNLHAWRDQVNDLSALRDVDFDEVERVESERGKDSSYDTMTVEDCKFWLEWLKPMPAKSPEGAEVAR